MHFAGRTWRPPHEANSAILQVTTGCAHNGCRFCSLYKNEPFRMSPMEEIEEDLSEIRDSQPRTKRIFLTGGNPFSLSYDNLMIRAWTIREYLPDLQNIAMFASIRDIKGKTVEQLKALRAMGINGLSIGTETGDNVTLELMNKKYTAQDIVEQCKKLDEADIEYYFTYLAGLAGSRNGMRNARATAQIYNQTNPYSISVTSLTLFPDTPLADLVKAGKYVLAGEKERLAEVRELTAGLQIRTKFFANTKTNPEPLTAFLPKEKERVISDIGEIIDKYTEADLVKYRNTLDSL